MGFFQRSNDDSHATVGRAGHKSADADQVAGALDRISRLSPPERAAELLKAIARAIEQADDYMGMRVLLASWLPDSDWYWSPEQRATWFSLELLLQGRSRC